MKNSKDLNDVYLQEYTKALNFATQAHKGQTRLYTNEPYINHCTEVADILKSEYLSITTIQAALLHDVLEDTDVDENTILTNFGQKVLDRVIGCTQQSKLSDGNRRIRKNIDLQHYLKQSNDVKKIKAADMISNSRGLLTGIAMGDKQAISFAKVYFTEKEDMCDSGLFTRDSVGTVLMARIDELLTLYKEIANYV